MDQPGLDNRHRDKKGRAKKHGNTRIGPLRKYYGAHFATGKLDSMRRGQRIAQGL